jgi:hypothetical protein
METKRVSFMLPSPKHWLAAILIVPALLAANTASAQDAPVFPPGSHFGLQPPAGFVVSPDFMGFMEGETSASIVINELAGSAYPQLRAGFTADRLAAQGMALLGTCENVTIAVESTCLRANQEANGFVFQKWLLLARFGEDTALVVVTVPEVVLADGVYSAAAVEASLSSIAYTATPAASALDALSFTIAEGDLLSFQRALGGSGALYTGQGAAGAPQPLWIVAASLAARAQARQPAFSRLAFSQIGSVSNAQVAKQQPLAVGELEGHLIEGSGQDEDTGQALYLFQAILVDEGDKYYRMIGIVPAAQQETYRPEFLRLMQTLTPR